MSIFEETSIGRPALAIHRGELFVAWTDADRKLCVMPALGGGDGKHVLEETSDSGPALASHAGDLYVAWTGTDGDGHLNVMPALSGDGSGKRILNETSTSSPALASHPFGLMIAWRGRDGEGHLNVMPALDDDASRKETLAKRTLAEPALGYDEGDGELYLAWTSADNGRRLCYTPVFGDRSILSAELDDTSFAGPSLSHGVLGWSGDDGDHKLNWMTMRTPSSKRILGDTSDNGPSVWSAGGVVYMAWTGKDGRHRINVTELS